MNLMAKRADVIFLSLFNLSNKLLVALLFTLSYYSLFVVLTPYISFFLTIPAYIVSLLMSFLFYKLGSNFYKSFFIDRVKKHLTDIVINKNVQQSFDAEENYINKRYYLEYNIIIASFSFFIFLLTYILQGLTNTISNVAIANLRFQYLTSALSLYLTYIAASILIGMLYEKSATLRGIKLGLKLYIYLYSLLFWLVVTLFIFLKSYFTILYKLM